MPGLPRDEDLLRVANLAIFIQFDGAAIWSTHMFICKARLVSLVKINIESCVGLAAIIHITLHVTLTLEFQLCVQSLWRQTYGGVSM